MDCGLLLVAPKQQSPATDRLERVLVAFAPNPTVTRVDNARDALAALADSPKKYRIVILDLSSPGLPGKTLIQGLKEIDPEVEILLIGPAGNDLPEHVSPLVLPPSVSPETIGSSVAKLLELVKLRQEHLELGLGFRGHIYLARKNMDAVLALLNRPVGVGMISMRRDGFFTFYNPQVRNLTGYSQDEAPNFRKWVEFLVGDPAVIQDILTVFNRFWTEGANRHEIRIRARHKDGTMANLSVTVLILQDDKGQPRQMVILLFDPKDQALAQAFRLLMDSGPIGLYTYHQKDGLGLITWPALEIINQAFSLQLAEEDLLGRQILDLPLPDPQQALSWQDHLENVLALGKIQKTGLPPMGLPGRRLLQHVFLAPLGSDTGTPNEMMAVVVRRDELNAQAYHKLSTGELCQLTLMNLPQPFMLFKADRNTGGDIIDFTCKGANKAAGNLMDLTSLSGDNLSLSNLFPDPAAMKTIMKHAVYVTDNGGEEQIEFPVRLKQDHPEKCLYHFWLGKAGDGVAIFFRDVTDKRREEHILKQYQHVFNHMEESIIVTDLEGNIIDWNPASTRMFGYTKKEILKHKTSILTVNKKGEPLPNETRNILREGDVWKGEYQFSRRDGSWGLAGTVFTILKDENGAPYGTVGLSRDVTEDKRMEERLKTRTRELQEKNLALNTLLRHAEEERIRACEQVASDVIARITQGVNEMMGAKSKPEMVEHLGRLLLKELEGTKMQSGDGRDPLDTLSDKELEVARLIRLGKTTEEIAFILDKSSDTVRLQRISIRKKLGLKTRDRNLHNYLNKLKMF